MRDVRRVWRCARRRFAPRVDDEVPKAIIARYLPAAPVIVEAGAHRGFDTVQLSRQFPDGIVHAFEPVPGIYAALRERTASHANVRTYRQALAKATGTSVLYVSDGASDQSSSLRRPKTHLQELPDITFDRMIDVRTSSLDDWAAKYGIERVDLFWLDLQGAELDALQGGEGLLSSAAAVYTEVVATEQYEGAALYPELRRWLEDRGFAVEVEWLPWGGGNVLFVRPRTRPQRARIRS
jgi:FkbM family methyltransferase